MNNTIRNDLSKIPQKLPQINNNLPHSIDQAAINYYPKIDPNPNSNPKNSHSRANFHWKIMKDRLLSQTTLFTKDTTLHSTNINAFKEVKHSNIPRKSNVNHQQTNRNYCELLQNDGDCDEHNNLKLSSTKQYISHRDITTYNLCKKSVVTKNPHYITHAYIFDLKHLFRADNYSSEALTKMKVLVREKSRISLDDLRVANKEIVDNTGNVGIWFSEECMAFLLLKLISRVMLDETIIDCHNSPNHPTRCENESTKRDPSMKKYVRSMIDIDEKQNCESMPPSSNEKVLDIKNFNEAILNKEHLDKVNMNDVILDEELERRSLKETTERNSFQVENMLRRILTQPPSDKKEDICTILELGCGTGLAGFAMYQYLHTVLATKRNEYQSPIPLENIVTSCKVDTQTRDTKEKISYRYIPPHRRKFEIILSDGNSQVCSNVTWNYENICAQRFSSNDQVSLNVEYIPWQLPETYSKLRKRVNFITVSDCLFFHSFHEDLLQVLETCLKTDGVVWILAPKRSPTMDIFLRKVAEKGIWKTKVFEKYDVDILNCAEKLRKEYQELFRNDIHYPLLITMEFKSETSNTP